MGLGDFLRYSQTISELMTAFAWFGNSATGFHNNVKYIEKFFEYVDIPTEMHYGTIPTEKRSDNIYDIEFHNVSFRYPHSDVYAIKNLSFKFKVGEKVAVAFSYPFSIHFTSIRSISKKQPFAVAFARMVYFLSRTVTGSIISVPKTPSSCSLFK